MPKYIDKDSLLHKMQERCDKLSEQYGTENDYIRGYGAAIDAIDVIALKETADVQEVKHAKDLMSTEPFGGGSFECSNCHFYDDDTYTIDTEIGRIKYCPNCGAKIDLEDDK